MDNRISKNVQNIRQNHKQSLEKLQRGINNRKTNPSRVENPESHLPGRLALTTAICYRNYATPLFTKEILVGVLQIYKVIDDQSPSVHG